MNEKIFYKKKMNTTSLKGPEIITNSLDGLISYYTAANIRNKVKHPFFIAIRFSECCSLYYNKEHINETSVCFNNKSLIFLLFFRKKMSFRRS